jgi:hypothetical protein
MEQLKHLKGTADYFMWGAFMTKPLVDKVYSEERLIAPPLPCFVIAVRDTI